MVIIKKKKANQLRKCKNRVEYFIIVQLKNAL